MDIICSSAGVVNPFRPGQGIMDLADAGFENTSFEFDMCCSGYELEHYGEKKEDEEAGTDRQFLPVSEHPEEIRRFFEKMHGECVRNHLRIPVALAPYLPRDTKRGDLAGRLTGIQKECIRYCGETGCGYLVVRPLYADYGTDAVQESVPADKDAVRMNAAHREAVCKDAADMNSGHGDALQMNFLCSYDAEDIRQDEWRLNREYYLGLAETAREHGVMVLLANQCRNRNGRMVRSVCSDGEEAAMWIDRLNREAGEERFGFCMDVGVLSLCGQDMYEFALALGDRLKAVVLRDCDGQNEGSMLPFTCACMGKPRTDWLRLLRGLREIGFDGRLILNACDTVVTFSPLLRPPLLRLAKATADYFKWQIGIENLLKKYPKIVLFGAGNMCRNYMKCYGEKYPPLFTCDNNEKTWGTVFCGLEVKPPEALKGMPKDCGVFICNIYYREIEQQLRVMGVENIEFFNDEYMPSFYFDRLKGV